MRSILYSCALLCLFLTTNLSVDAQCVPTTWHRDWDGDGHGASYDYEPTIISCEQPEGYVSSSDDCNDYDGSIHAGAIDICDGVDNDCDGLYDEDTGEKKMYYHDYDLDGYGVEPGQMLSECEAYYVSYITPLKGDCNDQDWAIHPDALELCDAVDNNCNGQVDEGFKDTKGYKPITWYRDVDGDGYGTSEYYPIVSCTQPAGYVANNLDCGDTQASVYPGAPEICDHQDNDCNGLEDDGIPVSAYYADQDQDGYGAGPALQLTECAGANNWWVTKVVGDCDDTNPNLNPAAAEVCDGLDNNCNGEVDEGFRDVEGYNPQIWYPDQDGDGYGDAYAGSYIINSCTQPEGYVANALDCRDGNPTVYPGAPEICDHEDNDCNGYYDDGLPRNWYYVDWDGDGYGWQDGYFLTECEAQEFPWGTLITIGGDFNDSDPAINPDAVEVCDAIDNNCDGQIDEGFNPQYRIYMDYDGDGYGYDETVVALCDPDIIWEGYVRLGGDCQDQDPNIHPGVIDLCDDYDNDCDGLKDEDSEMIAFYRDNDWDGYGSGEPVMMPYCFYGVGYSRSNGDCDDRNPRRYTGALELCDGEDNNCDGVIDEGCTIPLLSISDIYLMETEAYAELTVRLFKPSSKKISVSYTTVEGSAKSKVAKGTIADFVAQKGKVTIPAGALSATIRIPLLNDGIVDGNKQFYVQLSKPHNAELFKEKGYVLIRDASSSYLSKAAAAPDKQVEAVQLTAKAFPNPSNTHFTIKTQGQAGEKINVRIMDALGRIVETKSNVPVNGSLVLGHSYRPGMYYAEIVQGSQKVTLKLVKQ